MAELTSLKKQRSAAKQKFTRYFNLLSELIKEDADILEINVLFDVSGAWRVVELRNDEYINMVPDDSTENCDEWIAPIEKNDINIRKEVSSIKRRTERKDLCESSKRVYLVKDCNFIAQCKRVYLVKDCNFIAQCKRVYLVKDCNFIAQCKRVYLVKDCNFIAQCKRVYLVKGCNFIAQCKRVYLFKGL